MRIGGGILRGRGLRVPPRVRPTGGLAREALFDIWAPRIAGSRFLDLFAGSGAVGIEAFSRGAALSVAVERSAPVFRVLATNYKTLVPGGEWQLLQTTLPAGLSSEKLQKKGPFDLVFADPPYDFTGWHELLEGIAPLLAQEGQVALEHGRRGGPPDEIGPLVRRSRRVYGETELAFYERSGARPLSAERPR